jgi:hypothetical protein
MTTKNRLAKDGVIFTSDLEINFYSDAYLEDEIPNPVSQLLYHLEEDHLKLQHADLDGGILHHKGINPRGYDFSYPAEIYVMYDDLERFLKTIIDVINTCIVDQVDRQEYLSDDIHDEEGNMTYKLVFQSIGCDRNGIIIQEFINQHSMEVSQRIYIHFENLSRLKKFCLKLQSSI